MTAPTQYSGEIKTEATSVHPLSKSSGNTIPPEEVKYLMEATGQSVVLTAPQPKVEDTVPEPSPAAPTANTEQGIVATDYFLDNCEKIIKYALFKSGTLYLNSLLPRLQDYNKLEQLCIHQFLVYCMLKMRDYSQAQKICRSMEFSSDNCRFETYPELAGARGSMVGFPFLYFDAIIPYLLDKAAHRLTTLHKLNQLLLEAKQKLKSPELLSDVSALSPKLQQVYKVACSMFSLFPQYNGIANVVGQVKVVTLEIVKVHVAESEHRVAHLMLSNLCKQFPEDPHLWSSLAKLYLEIGKREAAVATFSKAEEMLAKIEGISVEQVEATKMFNAYAAAAYKIIGEW